MPRSAGQLLPRDLTRTYPRIVRGEGVNVYDADGKRYLDAIAGIAVVNVGHGRAQVAEALAAQAQTIAYVQSSIFDNQPAHELAERLGRFATKVCCPETDRISATGATGKVGLISSTKGSEQSTAQRQPLGDS